MDETPRSVNLRLPPPFGAEAYSLKFCFAR